LLQSLGHTVFHDHRSIKPGRAWESDLQTGLDEADAVLVYWTKNSARSDWVRKEYEFFIATYASRLCVPMRVDDTPLTELLKTRQAADFLAPVTDALDTKAALLKKGKKPDEIIDAVIEQLEKRGARVKDRDQLQKGLLVFLGFSWWRLLLKMPLAGPLRFLRGLGERAAQLTLGRLATAAAILALGLGLGPMAWDATRDPPGTPEQGAYVPTEGELAGVLLSFLDEQRDTNMRLETLRVLIDLMNRTPVAPDGSTAGLDERVIRFVVDGSLDAPVEELAALLAQLEDERVRVAALLTLLNAGPDRRDSIFHVIRRSGGPETPTGALDVLVSSLESVTLRLELTTAILQGIEGSDQPDVLFPRPIPVQGPAAVMERQLASLLRELRTLIRAGTRTDTVAITVPAEQLRLILLPFIYGLVPATLGPPPEEAQPIAEGGGPDGSQSPTAGRDPVLGPVGDALIARVDTVTVALPAPQWELVLLPHAVGATSVHTLMTSPLRGLILHVADLLLVGTDPLPILVSAHQARLLIFPHASGAVPAWFVEDGASLQGPLATLNNGLAAGRDPIPLQLTAAQARLLLLPHVSGSAGTSFAEAVLAGVGTGGGVGSSSGADVGSPGLDSVLAGQLGINANIDSLAVDLRDRAGNGNGAALAVLLAAALTGRPMADLPDDAGDAIAAVAAEIDARFRRIEDGLDERQRELLDSISAARLAVVSRPDSSRVLDPPPAPTTPDPDAAGAARYTILDPAEPGAFLPPQPRQTPRPEYPEGADGLEGVIDVEAVIDTTGAVEVVETWAPASLRILADAAESTVGGWTFHPGRLNDVKVPVRLRVAVTFTYRRSSEPRP